MTTFVFVLDRKGRRLMPCHPARARKLLKKDGHGFIRFFPFTIRLTDRELENSSVQPMLIKIDPGSKETGIALVREEKTKSIMLLYFINLQHRGQQIRNALHKRRVV